MKNKIFSALSAALLMCLFAAGCGSNDTVDCPDLVGKSYGYVSAAEQYADIVLSVTYDKSDADDAGRITSQDVKPGTKIERGSTVSTGIHFISAILSAAFIMNAELQSEPR